MAEPYVKSRSPYQDALPYSNYSEAFPPTPHVSPAQAPTWRPGFLGRFPWVPIAALLICIICTIASAVALVKLNGQSIEIHQKLRQPSVIVSITSAIYKLALGYALAEGAMIFWWNKAVKGSTVKDLSRAWEYGQGFKGAVLSGKHVNFLAVATVVVTLCAAVGPLLQRATSVVVATTTHNITLSGHVASELPQGYSASLTAQSADLGGVSLAFAQILSGYYTQKPIVSDLQGCEAGNCTTTLQAAGITAVCGSPVVSDWGINVSSDQSGVTIFQVNSSWINNGVEADMESLEQITLSVCKKTSYFTSLASSHFTYHH